MPWAAIGPIASGIGSILGGIFGSKKPSLGGAGNQAQSNLLSSSNGGAAAGNEAHGLVNSLPGYTNFGTTSSWFPIATTALGNAERSTNTGNDLLTSAQGAFKPAQDYWQAILHGGPQAFQAISPTVQASNAAYNQAKTSLSNFAPMGGGRASQLQQLPFQQAGAIGNMFSQLQPQAAQQLANLGTAQGGLGTSLSNANTSLAGGLVNSLGNQNLGLMQTILQSLLGLSGQGQNASNSLINTDLTLQGIGNQNGANLGGGLFNIFNSIPWGSIGGGGGGTNLSGLPLGTTVRQPNWAGV